jgi:hypothetical protein
MATLDTEQNNSEQFEPDGSVLVKVLKGQTQEDEKRFTSSFVVGRTRSVISG